MASPVYVQSAFRFRNDDGTLANATFIDALDTDVQYPLDTVFRLRFVVQNTAANADTGDQTYELWCSKNGGTYFQVTASSTLAQLANDTNSISDNAATAQLIGSGTYTGNTSNGYNDGTSDDVTGTVNITRSTEAEVECCLKLLTTNNSNGDTFDFRLRRSINTVLDTYTSTPRMTAGAQEHIVSATSTLGRIGQAAQAAVVVAATVVSTLGGVSQEANAIHSSTPATGASITSTLGSISQSATADSPAFAISPAGLITINNPSKLSSGQTWKVVVRATDTAAGIPPGVHETDTGDITIILTAGEPTASITSTLGAVSQAATARTIVTASVTSTLGAVSQAATTEVVVTASAISTLGAVEQDARAKSEEAARASIISTLGAVSQAANTSVIVSAAATSTLGAVSQSGSIVTLAERSSSIVSTLGQVEQSATAQVIVSASATSTLGAIEQIAAAERVTDKTASITSTLGAIEQAAAATVDVSAFIVSTLGSVGQVALASGGFGAGDKVYLSLGLYRTVIVGLGVTREIVLGVER